MTIVPFEEAVTWIEEPLPDGPSELIPGLLPKRGQLMIAGETEVGKSLVALEISSALLTGTPLWGSVPVAEVVERVVYILGEHDPDIIQSLWNKTKLKAPTESLALMGPDVFPEHFVISGGFRQAESAHQLRTWVRGAGLVIFDPLTSFIRGVDAENDNIQMRMLVDTLTQAAHAEGAACLVLAHVGKPHFLDGKPSARAKYAIRGASGTEDAATNIFYLERLSEDEEDALLFRLKKRKYKGTAPDYYYLSRDKATLTHTLLEGRRPRVEARRQQFQDKVARAQTEFPDQTRSCLIESLARIEGISRRTAFRYIEGQVDDSLPAHTPDED